MLKYRCCRMPHSPLRQELLIALVFGQEARVLSVKAQGGEGGGGTEGDLLAGWACSTHSMARYSVESTMPAALPLCQGLSPTLGLDPACSVAGFAPPSPAGQSAIGKAGKSNLCEGVTDAVDILGFE